MVSGLVLLWLRDVDFAGYWIVNFLASLLVLIAGFIYSVRLVFV